MLERYMEDPELGIKHPAALRQIKQAAGALAEDGPPQVMINLGAVRQHLRTNLGLDDDNVVDGELTAIEGPKDSE